MDKLFSCKVQTALHATHLGQICTSVGCATDQAVSCQPFIVEARVWSLVSPREICGRRIGNVTGFSLPVLQFPLSVSFHQCSTHIFMFLLLLSERQRGVAWEPSEQW